MTRLLITAALAAAATLVLAPLALAKTYNVNKIGDHVPDACTADDCTLREAVIEANAHTGLDRIVLARGKRYGLALSGTDDTAALGDLDITDSISIERGPARTKKQRKARATVDAHGIDRVFEVISTTATATFKGVVITGGFGADDGGITGDDGALTLVDSLVRGNAGSADVGGIDANDCSLRLVRTTISGNHGGADGGLHVGDGATIVDSRISGNRTADANGAGGLDLNGPVSTIKRTVFSRNHGGNDGAIDTNLDPGEKLTVDRSRFIKNTGDTDVGGIDADEELKITDSLFSGNRGGSNGGAIFNDDNLTLTGSTLSDNRAGLAGTGDGGAIYSSSDSLIVRNSTIANNAARGAGGGIWSAGTTTLNNVTVARNLANSDDLGLDFGGGLRASSGSFTVSNSLIALNTTGTTGGKSNCDGGFTSGGHNLRGQAEPGCSGFSAPGDLVRANPKLGLLHKNGGFTPTVALLKGSPAINRGGSDAEPRDQRGIKHVSTRDIGAFEYKPKKKKKKHHH